MAHLPDLDHLMAAVVDDARNEDPLELLTTAAHVRDDLEELAEALLDVYVERARQAGCSWSQIGQALGVSKQAVQQRHSTTNSIARRLLAWLPSRRHWHRPPFAHFADRARDSVVHAEDEARALRHNYIGTEHLLLGLLRLPEGVAARALQSLDISLQAVRDQVVEIIGQGATARSSPIPFTPRSKKVLELSLREAHRLRHNYVGTEHILLGIVAEGEGIASQILSSLGADPDRTREAVTNLLATTPPQQQPDG